MKILGAAITIIAFLSFMWLVIECALWPKGVNTNSNRSIIGNFLIGLQCAGASILAFGAIEQLLWWLPGSNLDQSYFVGLAYMAGISFVMVKYEGVGKMAERMGAEQALILLSNNCNANQQSRNELLQLIESKNHIPNVKSDALTEGNISAVHRVLQSLSEREIELESEREKRFTAEEEIERFKKVEAINQSNRRWVDFRLQSLKLKLGHGSDSYVMTIKEKGLEFRSLIERAVSELNATDVEIFWRHCFARQKAEI